ncbi:ligand-binding sensor domain-containing protein [Massilia sp. SM-13]|uniref:ligand-binding sensor domain-containing protein n=1 Tax=Pseudoduganella rhizocola TaxID=3382643 RepID=UPI0038B52429
MVLTSLKGGHLMLLGMLVLSLLAPRTARALDPDRSISQYAHTTWRMADGELPGIPHAFTQTADGYLWIGTEGGLVRFDGVRFVPWQAPAGDALCECAILSLLGARDGSLWIGTPRSLYRVQNGVSKKYPFRSQINHIIEDSAGAVWIAMSRLAGPKEAPLCRITQAATTCYGADEGLPLNLSGLSAIADDGSGGLWLGTVQGVYHWTPAGISRHLPPSLATASGATGVLALARQPDGSVLVGVGQNGQHLGLQRLRDGRWTDFRAHNADGTAWAVSALHTDRSGGLWIGTVRDGIYHVQSKGVDHFSHRDGLASESVEAFFEDREGNIWVASSQGLDRFRDSPVISVSAQQGLSGDKVASVAATRAGGLWVGNGNAVDYLENGKRVYSLTADDLRGKQVTALLIDDQDRLWYGVDENLMVREKGRSRMVTKSDGSALGVVISVVQDGEHNIWAVTTGRPQTLHKIQDAKAVESVPIPQSAAGGAIRAGLRQGVWIGGARGKLQRYARGQMTEVTSVGENNGIGGIWIEPDDSLWVATSHGIARWKDQRLQIMDRKNGLPCNSIDSLIKDDAGTLWVYASCGLVSIPAAELNAWWARPDMEVKLRSFGLLDGYVSGSTPFSPVVAKSTDGRLWYANERLLQVIDPHRLPDNRVAPPVHIEAIVADRRRHAPADGLQLPALTKDIQIDYVALSYTLPQKIKFRYKLEGHDTAWQEAGSRRQAFYNDLRPGSYRFRVIACNNDGVWNEAGAALSFSIAPAYYQTAWFHALAAALTVTFLYVAYRMRVRQIATALTARFNERTAERTRLAAELHDTILQSIQATKLIADHARHEAASKKPVELNEAIVSISNWLAQATQEARAALTDLRLSTMEKNDLATAFQRSAESFGVSSAMRLTLSVEGKPRDLHPIVREEIYRIGNEAIRNGLRHSDGTSLEIALIYSHKLVLRIADDGKGIPPDIASSGKPGHFGLVGMQERARRINAKLNIESGVNGGTVVELLVPGKNAYEAQDESLLERLWARIRAIFARRLPANANAKEICDERIRQN